MKKAISIACLSISFSCCAIAQMNCDTIFSFPLKDTWPTGIAWDGRHLWTSGSTDAYIYKYMANGMLVDSIPSPSDVFGVQSLLFIGPHLWTVSEEQDIIYELDTINGVVVSQIQLPVNTNNWGLTYDGVDLLVSNYIDGTLFKVNPSSGQVFGFIEMPIPVLDIKFINGSLFGVSRFYDRLYKIDENNGSLLDSIAWCVPYPLGITWDGEHLWNISSAVFNGGNQRAYKLDLGTFLTSSTKNLSQDALMSLSVFPNPVADMGTMEFDARERGALRLDLFDCFGKMVKTLLHEEIAAGKHRETFDLSDIPAGIYVVGATFEERHSSFKLVVAR